MRNSRFRPDPKRGDLVDVRFRSHGGSSRVTVCHGALVLEYHSSNVYEPASCQLFHDGEIFWAKTRDITIVTDREDVKKA